MIYVVDTSALLRLFIPDGPEPEELADALRETERGNASLIAPELALAEAAQVILKKHRRGLLTRKETDELLADILSLPISYFSHRPLIAFALELASERGLTVYDALFLALAERQSAQLITLDARLRKAAENRRK
jgi:predicted nucleic acid-binding protein